MKSLTLFTSGSTNEPKIVKHNWDHLRECIQHSIRTMKLTSEDRVLNVFPHNVIAHYCITAGPAQMAGADLLTAKFSAYDYADIIDYYKPTVTSLITPHIKMLMGTKSWDKLDLSSVRYLVIGSQTTPDDYITALKDKGVQYISNWYGSTEFPPPVFTADWDNEFDLSTVPSHFDVAFDNGRCIINGEDTKDDFQNNRIIPRQLPGNNTWKS